MIASTGQQNASIDSAAAAKLGIAMFSRTLQFATAVGKIRLAKPFTGKPSPSLG
jgi:hypothetical protein